MLDVVPGGPEAEHGATTGDRIERRRQLREERRVAVRDPGDERSELNAARLTGERRQGRPALEHRLVDGSDAADLLDVVHDRDEAKPALLGGPGLFDGAIEQLRRGYIGMGVAG